MNLNFINDKTFTGKSFTSEALPKGEYDNCIFVNCDFSESYLSNINFLDCEFIDCNLSMVKTKGTTLKDVIFNNCKLVGFPFHDCNAFLFTVTFNDCQLKLSSFYNLKLKSTSFNSCKLEQTDFTNTDLSASKFIECNLYQTVFDNTNLEKVDFVTSYNLSINPETNRIKNASFSKENALGLLTTYKINIE
ncbi:pentapeptide repeat-containing protein [Psychroserpens jangbogonensis]|uniref:pentapeptide repeat-containing protein n=1 Tax=Psychroserpens jangbogonensis TaxID=1484460 RepID=UPI00053DA819|nr:pentapeptide repeat-containing protein [Psychroserpens jangbogonensis]